MKNYQNPYEAPKLEVNGERFNYLIENQDENFLGLIATDDGWCDTNGKKTEKDFDYHFYYYFDFIRF